MNKSWFWAWVDMDGFCHVERGSHSEEVKKRMDDYWHGDDVKAITPLYLASNIHHATRKATERLKQYLRQTPDNYL